MERRSFAARLGLALGTLAVGGLAACRDFLTPRPSADPTMPGFRYLPDTKQVIGLNDAAQAILAGPQGEQVIAGIRANALAHEAEWTPLLRASVDGGSVSPMTQGPPTCATDCKVCCVGCGCTGFCSWYIIADCWCQCICNLYGINCSCVDNICP